MARKPNKKREIVKFLSGLAAILSISVSLFAFHRYLSPVQANQAPVRTEFEFSHDDHGTRFTWKQIPGSAPLVPGTLQPKIAGEPLNTPPSVPPPSASPLPNLKPKPRIWDRHYKIEKLSDDVEIGDPSGDQAIKLKQVWRTCDRLDRHPICSLSPQVRQNAPPLIDY